MSQPKSSIFLDIECGPICNRVAILKLHFCLFCSLDAWLIPFSLLLREAVYLFQSKIQTPMRSNLHTSHKSLSLYVWFLVLSGSKKPGGGILKMRKCDSSECRGTLFMTARGNNSSLPANFSFLRGRRHQCQSWIDHSLSHNTPHS